MILGLSVVHEVTKNFHAAHVQDKQLERVERRRGGREQATKLIQGQGWITEAVALSRLIIQTGS